MRMKAPLIHRWHSITAVMIMQALSEMADVLMLCNATTTIALLPLSVQRALHSYAACPYAFEYAPARSLALTFEC